MDFSKSWILTACHLWLWTMSKWKKCKSLFFITINKKFVSDVPGLREELQVHLPQHSSPDLLHAPVFGRGPG